MAPRRLLSWKGGQPKPYFWTTGFPTSKLWSSPSRSKRSIPTWSCCASMAMRSQVGTRSPRRHELLHAVREALGFLASRVCRAGCRYRDTGCHFGGQGARLRSALTGESSLRSQPRPAATLRVIDACSRIRQPAGFPGVQLSSTHCYRGACRQQCHHARLGSHHPSGRAAYGHGADRGRNRDRKRSGCPGYPSPEPTFYQTVCGPQLRSHSRSPARGGTLRSHSRGLHWRCPVAYWPHRGSAWRDSLSRRDRRDALGLQAKMLRFLENGEIQRVGDNETVRGDVRVVAATHQDLEARASTGDFRLDLFHRLAVFPSRSRRCASGSTISLR